MELAGKRSARRGDFRIIDADRGSTGERVRGATLSSVASRSLAAAISGERKKAEWNPWWILGWYVTTLWWIGYGLWARDFTRGTSAFVVLFFPQELFAIRKDNDAFPPLTHVVRNRFPSWLAFPLIFAAIAAVSARWATLDWRSVGLITLPVAALGWLIEHFLATYAGPDPRRGEPAAGRQRRAA